MQSHDGAECGKVPGADENGDQTERCAKHPVVNVHALVVEHALSEGSTGAGESWRFALASKSGERVDYTN